MYTVKISILGLLNGEAYAVQRLTTHLEGSVISEDRIAGSIAWTNEQVVLVASNPLPTGCGNATKHADPGAAASSPNAWTRRQVAPNCCPPGGSPSTSKGSLSHYDPCPSR